MLIIRQNKKLEVGAKTKLFGESWKILYVIEVSEGLYETKLIRL